MKLSHGYKTMVGMEWVRVPLCQVFDDLPSSALMWNTPTQLNRDPYCQLKDGFIPSLHQTRRNKNTSNSTKPDEARHEGMPK